MKIAFYCIITALFCIQYVYANTEKLVLQVDSKKIEPCDPQFAALSKAQATISLTPPFSEIQNSIVPQYEFQWYNLDGIRDNANYEIRLSYPAITPADFHLKIINNCKRMNGSLSFTLQVSAIYTGVSQSKDMDNQSVVYNLVLENLYFGFLFYQVYKIAIATSAVLLIGFFLWMPYIKSLITKKLKNE